MIAKLTIMKTNRINLILIVITHVLLLRSQILISNVNSHKNLSLKQAKKYALSSNYFLKTVKSEIVALEAKLEMSESLFYPSLDLTLGANRFEDRMKKSDGIAYASFHYNLFNGFRDSVKSELASLNIQKKQLELAKATFGKSTFAGAKFAKAKLAKANR